MTNNWILELNTLSRNLIHVLLCLLLYVCSLTICFLSLTYEHIQGIYVYWLFGYYQWRRFYDAMETLLSIRKWYWYFILSIHSLATIYIVNHNANFIKASLKQSFALFKPRILSYSNISENFSYTYCQKYFFYCFNSII